MCYKINKTNASGQYVIVMDYDPRKVVTLCDALDADENLDCYQFTGFRKLNMHQVFLRILDKKLRNVSDEAKTEYIDKICKPILEESHES